MNENILVLTAF